MMERRRFFRSMLAGSAGLTLDPVRLMAEPAPDTEELAGLKYHRTAGAQMVAGVPEMKANGVRVPPCRNTIAKWSRDPSAASGETPEAVQVKILKGLSSGVEPVPAMIVAAVLAQARSHSYVAIG